MTLQIKNLKTPNDWADFYYYELGQEPIPWDVKKKSKGILLNQYKIWFKEPLPEEQFKQWKDQGMYDKGIAIIIGQSRRGPFKGLYLCSIDMDNKKGIDEMCPTGINDVAKKTLVEQHKDNPNKAHIYYFTHKPVVKKSSDIRNPELEEKIKNNEIPAFEVKGNNGHGVMFCTPSQHEDGSNYQVLGTLQPQVYDYIEQKIEDICSNYGIPYLMNAKDGKSLVPMSELTKKDFKILQGHNRHESLMRYMESKISRNPEFSDAKILQLGREWNNEHCEPPLDEKELQKQFNDAKNFIIRNNEGFTSQKLELGHGLGKKNDYDLTHLEYSNLVLKQCEIKTLTDTQEILHKENGVYTDFGKNKIKQILLEINPELEINTEREIIEKIRQITDTPRKEFDKNEFEICLPNGIVNVKTSKFSEYDPEKLFRTQLPVTYDPKATCPKFVKFMHTTLPLPDDYIDQIEAFSTGLIQNTPKLEAMFFETGEGDNSKSTFFNIINWFYGKENYSTVSIHDLINDRFAKIRLEGKRINTFPDIESGSLDNLGILKALVSGDEIDGQNKYERAHSFVNYAKLFFSANELPELKQKTFANFKRIRLTKWAQTFCKPNVYDIHKRKLKEEFKDLSDLELENELALNGFHKMNKQFINSIIEDENEKSGILNLLLIVIRNIIKRDGFFREYDIEELKEQWSENSTVVEVFDNDCLIKDPSSFVVKSETLWYFIHIVKH